MPKDTQDLARDFIKMEEVVNVVMLVTGDVIQYTVSSFPVFKGTLREVKLQWDDEEKAIHVFEAFACDGNLLDHHLPAIAVIHFNYENTYIIEVRNYFSL